MKFRMLFLIPAASLFSGLAFADEHKATSGDIKITPIFATELADLPGKEGMMLTVELPPGHASEAHRHEAHTFVYVLEGEIEMQVAGGELKNLKPGEAFYENPKDIHTVARNASKTKPAKFLVVFVKNTGAPPVLPAKN
jgi:quercetin dioxygenase-like cupin family protein